MASWHGSKPEGPFGIHTRHEHSSGAVVEKHAKGWSLTHADGTREELGKKANFTTAERKIGANLAKKTAAEAPKPSFAHHAAKPSNPIKAATQTPSGKGAVVTSLATAHHAHKALKSKAVEAAKTGTIKQHSVAALAAKKAAANLSNTRGFVAAHLAPTKNAGMLQKGKRGGTFTLSKSGAKVYTKGKK